MSGLPLRSIYISDFRRLSGHRRFELDAPVVLIHGANGTGKTSVLAALELGLTGQIRSMRRQDSRYTAYLPHIGQEFATVRVEVDKAYAGGISREPLTVGGSRIEGAPALDPASATFFSERCYLDQSSLGQLLELYQHTERGEESALARFVNELLGLEQLDALRSGLDPAGDWRRLKNLSELLEAASRAKDRADDALDAQTTELERAKAQLSVARNDLLHALSELDLRPETDDDDALLNVANSAGNSRPSEVDEEDATNLFHQLVSLSGRADAVSGLGSTERLAEAHARVRELEVAYQAWQNDSEPRVRTVGHEAESFGLLLDDDPFDALEREIRLAEQAIDRQSKLVELELPQAQAEYDGSRARLGVLAESLAAAQEQAGHLVEGLVALRAYVTEDVDTCPVCDRDYGEVSKVHLSTHMDRKIAELTTQGERLRDLRAERDDVVAKVAQAELRIGQVEAEVLDHDRLLELQRRRDGLTGLRQSMLEVQPIVREGSQLQRNLEDARDLAARLEEAAVELRHVSAGVARLAEVLGHGLNANLPVDTSAQVLRSVAEERLAEVKAHSRRVTAVALAEASFADAKRLVEQATQSVANAAQRRKHWEEGLAEARRRQSVARTVHRAAETARNEVVRHVFTESLNQLWQSVFARLAPREQYVPTFGDPSATRSALELSLQTVHVSGTVGGSPQIMLSAGNLNTAALSLFLALHLAVEPKLPCLVFDDPVQAMDEVHVAQFAGLIRMLSKHHKRQVVIAVHERELFEYLSLELSPAYEGDELLTIELGDRDDRDHSQVTRHRWRPDLAIAK